MRPVLRSLALLALGALLLGSQGCSTGRSQGGGLSYGPHGTRAHYVSHYPPGSYGYGHHPRYHYRRGHPHRRYRRHHHRGSRHYRRPYRRSGFHGFIGLGF